MWRTLLGLRTPEPRILFVCFTYNVHAACWVSLLDGAGHDVHVFPSQPKNDRDAEFHNITFWPAPEQPFDTADRPIRAGSWPSQMAADSAERQASVIAAGGFDVVHSLEFQHAGYLMLDALARLPTRRPRWIATNYGSDIALFGKKSPDHEIRIQEICTSCDYYSAECYRDIGLARELGMPTGRLDIICLPDQVSRAEIMRPHAHARVSLAVSIGYEISTALLEAMAMGSFPTKTFTACAEASIVDGRTGFIVRPDDPEKIAGKLAIAVSDDALVDHAAAINHARIRNVASQDSVVRPLRSAYEKVAA